MPLHSSQVTSDGAVLLRQLEEGGTDSDEAAAAKEGVLDYHDPFTGRHQDEGLGRAHAAACLGSANLAVEALLLNGCCPLINTHLKSCMATLRRPVHVASA